MSTMFSATDRRALISSVSAMSRWVASLLEHETSVVEVGNGGNGRAVAGQGVLRAPE